MERVPDAKRCRRWQAPSFETRSPAKPTFWWSAPTSHQAGHTRPSGEKSSRPWKSSEPAAGSRSSPNVDGIALWLETRHGATGLIASPPPTPPTMKALTYRLRYLADCDDMDPKKIPATRPYWPGDVLHLQESSGLYHLVVQRRELKTGTQLVLSKSAQSESEALLLAVQYKHWPAP